MNSKCQRRAGHVGAVALLLACAMSVVGAQSGPIQNAVFVHGAGGAYGGAWGYAINSLWNQHGFSFSADEPNIENSYRSTQWHSLIEYYMVPDSSILLGHSLGGVGSRDATQYVSAAGVISVGSPHTGAPIAASIASAVYLFEGMTGDIVTVFNWLVEALTSPLAEALAWGMIALIDNWIYYEIEALIEVGFARLEEELPPYFDVDLPPGSTFMNQLPTNVPDSYTLSATMYPGFYGGPLALLDGVSQGQADTVGTQIYYAGTLILDIAYSLYTYIDWEHENAWEAYYAVEAAANLGVDLMNCAFYWCGAVTSGNVFGNCTTTNDGLIPTSRQSFTGADNTPLTHGPAHTKQPYHADVITFIGNKLCDLSGECQ